MEKKISMEVANINLTCLKIAYRLGANAEDVQRLYKEFVRLIYSSGDQEGVLHALRAS
jgi:hypothetical protein